jgi:hypothetical protein
MTDPAKTEAEPPELPAFPKSPPHKCEGVNEARRAARASFQHYYDIMGIDPDAPPPAVADQMRSYATAAVLQERERAARIAEGEHFGGKHDDDLSWTSCAAHIAAAIRAQKEPT